MNFLLDTHAFLWWITNNPRGLFNVPDGIIGQRRNQVDTSTGAPSERRAPADGDQERGASRKPGYSQAERPFELRVVRSDDAASSAASGCRLALYQQSAPRKEANAAYRPAETPMQRVSELDCCSWPCGR